MRALLDRCVAAANDSRLRLVDAVRLAMLVQIGEVRDLADEIETIPGILAALGAADRPEISQDDFANLFVIATGLLAGDPLDDGFSLLAVGPDGAG